MEQGHEVTVVTGAPNFPTGRVHEGYRNRPYAVEDVDGIRVVRVWTYMAPNEGRFRRSLDYLSFMTSAIPAALMQRRPDVVVGTSPQLFTVLGAWVVSALRRVPCVFELRDLWPESIAAVGAAGDGLMLSALARLAGFLYHRVDRIVSVTESFADILEERGVPRGKVAVVRNGVDLEEFVPRDRDDSLRGELGISPDDFVVAYVGTIGMAHGLSHVAEAAEATAGEGVRYLIVGEGAEKSSLVEAVRARGLANVTFLDGQPRERVPATLAASDAVLVHLRDDPVFQSVIPSKIFEAMAMAKPIVHGVRGESAGIVRRADCGLTIEPEQPLELAAAVRALMNDPVMRKRLGENGRRAAEREFCRRTAALKMLDVLMDTAGVRADDRYSSSQP